MEKQDAAMDSRLPAFICATMSSRSVLLMLLINSIYLNKAPQNSVSTGDQTFAYTARGFHISFAYWLSGSFVECEHDCLSCAHCMGAKLLKIIRKQAIPILNKVKKAFFYVILVSTLTFTFLISYL